VTDKVLDTIIAGGFTVLVVLVQKLSVRVDGRLTQLLKLTEETFLAKGEKKELDRPKRAKAKK